MLERNKTRIDLPAEIRNDMELFVRAMEEEQIDVKSLGIPNATKEMLLGLLESCYL
jgi:hypothetical protein